MRYLIITVLLAIPAAVYAQDMPLSMFVKEGETWQPIDGGKYTPLPLRPQFTIPDLGQASAMVTTPDGGTVYVGFTTGRHVWAYRTDEEGFIQPDPAPYCPLRLKSGEDKLVVTDLTIDTAGRIYAATPENIQVFDPTGRLSGVLLLPRKGTPLAIGWEGENRDHLTVLLGHQKYARVMKATGLPLE